jgi:hypothetical protein
MTLELWNTFATFGTFLVIAATAIAALVQLRHARGSNQLEALNEIRESAERPYFRDALQFIRTELGDKLKDPAFRYQIENRAAITSENHPLIEKVKTVGNLYEDMGLLVKARFLDRELAMQMWNVDYYWGVLAEYTAIARRQGGDDLWENFEYLAVLAEDWDVKHPHGTYPAGMRRKHLSDPWLAADAQHVASLVTS